jgi:hypothetical protein
MLLICLIIVVHTFAKGVLQVPHLLPEIRQVHNILNRALRIRKRVLIGRKPPFSVHNKFVHMPASWQICDEREIVP